MKLLQRLRDGIVGVWDSTWARSTIVASTAIMIIALGFYYSVWISRDPDDAGRGGAVVVAMSFYFILRPDRHLLNSIPSEAEPHARKLIDRENNILLSLMSILGTIAWGFLDLVAEQFIYS